MIHVSSGEVIRNEVKSGLSRGLMLYNAMLNGQPIPNSIMTSLIQEEMLSRIMGNGIANKVFEVYIK